MTFLLDAAIIFVVVPLLIAKVFVPGWLVMLGGLSDSGLFSVFSFVMQSFSPFHAKKNKKNKKAKLNTIST